MKGSCVVWAGTMVLVAGGLCVACSESGPGGLGGAGGTDGCEDAEDCDDGVDCTDDVCSDGSCSNAPNDINCDNGLFCDGAETCDVEDDCQAGGAPTNDDAVLCTEDVCDEETDELFNSPVGFSNVRLVDVLEMNPITTVVLGTQVQVVADLSELCQAEIGFAYVVEFVDPAGERTVAWITGSLAPGQSFSPALSWVPDARGTHQVIASVREPEDDGMPDSWRRLTRQLSIVVEVE